MVGEQSTIKQTQLVQEGINRNKLTVEVSPVWSKLKIIDLLKSSPADVAPA
jgi:hypothetical protein